MTTFWKYFFVVFFILAVPVVAYFGYRSYKSLKNPSSPGFNAIVPNTPLIIEFREPKLFFDKLTEKTDFWQELIHLKSLMSFHAAVKHLDSVLSLDTQIAEILEKNKLYVSVHLSPQKRLEPLFIYELPSIGYKYTIENFIKKVNGEKSIVLQKKHLNATLSKLNVPGLDRLVSFAVHNGVFIGAFEEYLVKDAIDQMNSGAHLIENEQFKRLEVAAGKNVDANVYLNYPSFTELALALTGKDYHELVLNLRTLGEWSETDMMVKPGELLLTGYSMTPGDGSCLLDLFRQEPQPIRIPELLPTDVSVMVHFAFEDFIRFTASRRSYERQNKIPKAADSAGLSPNQSGLNITSYFNTWIGKEVAWATCGEKGDTSANRYVVIQANDIKVAADSLSKLNVLLNPEKKKKAYEEEFEDYIIRNLNIPGLFSVLFGPLYEGFNCPYYFTLRDYVVFANSPGAIKFLIANFYVQKTLAVNPNFRAISNGISDRSNVLFYCNTSKSLNTLAGFAAENLASIIRENVSTFRTFEGVAVQYSFTGDMFYTSIYLRYNPSQETVALSGWETELAGQVAGGPLLIRNEETGKLNVVVFDEFSNMYLLDHFGKILWKTPLIESPISQIFTANLSVKSKKHLLFNTESYLYLIDFSGNYTGDYPLKLMAPATNGLKLLEYGNQPESSFLIALSDNRIYKFGMDAKKSGDWETVTATKRVSRQVEQLSADGKDFLFITDDDGNVTIVNAEGEQKIKIRKSFKKAKNSGFHINETNSKGIFITTDNRGKLVYIDLSGKTDRTDFGDFSSGHFFLYEDINADDSKDFIFIDQRKLKAFNRFKETIFDFDFPGEVINQPVTFNNTNGELLIGVLSSGKLYFFNREGDLYKGNNYTGNTEFVAGSLNNDGKVNLLIGNGKKVSNYLLE